MKKKISKKISKNVSKKASKKVATKKKPTSPKNAKKTASKHRTNVVGKTPLLRKNIAKTTSKNATRKKPLNRHVVAKNLMNAIAKQFQIMLTPNEFIVRLTKNDFQQIEKLLSRDKSLIYCLLEMIRRWYPKYFDQSDCGSPKSSADKICENSVDGADSTSEGKLLISAWNSTKTPNK